jgi:hypothetical protein
LLDELGSCGVFFITSYILDRMASLVNDMRCY